MSAIEDVLKSKLKPKEKVAALAEQITGDPRLVPELIRCFDSGSVGDRGKCMEALESVVEKDPSFAKHCFDFVLDHLNDAAPRVRWEAARLVGNAAKQSPDKAVKAVPKLIENTKAEGTVVRWSAAFALTKIAKASPKSRTELIPKFERLAKSEENDGVRKIYVRALKMLQTS